MASGGTDSHAVDAASATPAGDQKKLDAGALFVLQSKGDYNPFSLSHDNNELRPE